MNNTTGQKSKDNSTGGLKSGLKGKSTPKKKAKSKKKPEKLSTLIKKLDKIFSQFIRLRDTDENGNGYCVTCNQKTTYRESNAGHFRRRGRMATRWDERNVNIQDVACNKYGNGKEYEHALYIDKTYAYTEIFGGTVLHTQRYSEIIHDLSKEDFKPGKGWLREQVEIYKEKVKELLKEKNFTI